jgi:hypothetical protein
MKEINEGQFKLALAIDLVLFMLEIWTKGQDEPGDTIKLLLDTWMKKVDHNSDILRNTMAETYVKNSEDVEMTKDIAMILLDIHSSDTKLWKREFEERLKDMITQRLGLSPLKNKMGP